MKKFLLSAISLIIAAGVFAQDTTSSSSSVVRRRSGERPGAKSETPGVTPRMQSHFEETPVDASELQWMRVMSRELAL
ncbi:MAG: hypothetical protein K2F68_00485, partial [Duncaniella sp.]|nr:hypothetical protein [Duncaniella sp.]